MVTPPAAALGIAFGVTVLMVTVFSYLAPAIAEDMGFSRPAVASALSLHIAVTVLSLPLAGALADRIGAQRVIVASAITWGLGIAAIGWFAVDLPGLMLGFVLAGILGAGVSPVCFNRVIVHRFTRRRGLALGIALSGTGLGGIILPWIMRGFLEIADWRIALIQLGAVAGFVGIVSGLLLGSEVRKNDPQTTPVSGLDLAEAVKTTTFWVLAGSFAIFGIAMSGFISQLQDLFVSLGLGAAAAPAFHALVGASTIGGRLIGGYLLDRIPPKFVGSGAAFVGALGMVVLAMDPTGAASLVIAGIAIGFCTGAESDVISYSVARFYGVRKFARIYAIQGSIFLIGFSAGPVLGALLLSGPGPLAHLSGSAALLCVAAGILLMLRR